MSAVIGVETQHGTASGIAVPSDSFGKSRIDFFSSLFFSTDKKVSLQDQRQWHKIIFGSKAPAEKDLAYEAAQKTRELLVKNFRFQYMESPSTDDKSFQSREESHFGKLARAESEALSFPLLQERMVCLGDILRIDRGCKEEEERAINLIPEVNPYLQPEVELLKCYAFLMLAFDCIKGGDRPESLRLLAMAEKKALSLPNFQKFYALIDISYAYREISFADDEQRLLSEAEQVVAAIPNVTEKTHAIIDLAKEYLNCKNLQKAKMLLELAVKNAIIRGEPSNFELIRALLDIGLLYKNYKNQTLDLEMALSRIESAKFHSDLRMEILQKARAKLYIEFRLNGDSDKHQFIEELFAKILKTYPEPECDGNLLRIYSLIDISSAFLANEEKENAATFLAVAENALELIRSDGLFGSQKKIDILIYMSKVYRRARNFAEADRMFQEAESIVKNSTYRDFLTSHIVKALINNENLAEAERVGVLFEEDDSLIKVIEVCINNSRLDEAERVANLMKDKSKKVLWLTQIAKKYFEENNRPEALRVLACAEGIIYQFTEDEKRDKEFSVDDLAQTYFEIREFDKLEALPMLYGVDVLGKVNRMISRSLDAGNIDQAERTARLATIDLRNKICALLDVAEKHIENKNLTDATRIFQEIENFINSLNEAHKSGSLAMLSAGYCKLKKFGEAKNVTERISDPREKFYSFLGIAEAEKNSGDKEESLRTLSKAEGCINSISDRVRKQDPIVYFIWNQYLILEAYPDAERVASFYHYDQGLVELNSIYIKQGKLTDAVRVSKQISDVLMRSQSLEEIAKAMIKEERLIDAKRFLQDNINLMSGSLKDWALVIISGK